jgi:selenocysteine lyase/cysteine desulfurase
MEDARGRTFTGLLGIDKVRLHVHPDSPHDHVPVIPFSIDDAPHGLVAARLGFEFGIGVRHGRHCADELILRLLGMSQRQQSKAIETAVEHGQMATMYGIVRPSIGPANTAQDIERLLEAVRAIAERPSQLVYVPQVQHAGGHMRETGEFIPAVAPAAPYLALGNPPASLLSIAISCA